MHYKAIIFDIDGTAVPNNRQAKPSERLINAVAQAKKQVHVSAASGRVLIAAKWVIDPLQLTSPSIVSAGAQIYDPSSQTILWEKLIAKEDVTFIKEIAAKHNVTVTFGSQYTKFPPIEPHIMQNESMGYVFDIDPSVGDVLVRSLENLPNIAVHQVPAYTPGNIVLNIVHKDATKRHALTQLKNILGVTKEETMVVGDGDNDLPLFSEAGFRVAMGNATDTLKKHADYIAPSATEDGLAHVIEKFILQSH